MRFCCARNRYFIIVNVMVVNKRHLIFAAVYLCTCFAAFFIGKGCNKPLETKIERDTVTLHDTVPDIAPAPKDSARIEYVTRWLPSVPDTVTQWKAIHDSVAVEVPITSKHYGSDDYDAWVSGFEPSLDSIKIYKETQYITTTITQSKPPNKLTLDVSAGADYFTERKELYPYIKGNLQYNINERWSVGAQGGMYKADETQPFAGGYVKIKVF